MINMKVFLLRKNRNLLISGPIRTPFSSTYTVDSNEQHKASG